MVPVRCIKKSLYQKVVVSKKNAKREKRARQVKLYQKHESSPAHKMRSRGRIGNPFWSKCSSQKTDKTARKIFSHDELTGKCAEIVVVPKSCCTKKSFCQTPSLKIFAIFLIQRLFGTTTFWYNGPVPEKWSNQKPPAEPFSWPLLY